MFDYFERSAEQAAPVTLYMFRYGEADSSYYAYTDSETDLTVLMPVNGVNTYVVFKAIPISRGTINASGTLDKQQFDVTVPFDTEISELFRVYPPSSVVTLVVYQGNRTDPDGQFLACWSGRIVATSVSVNERKLIGEPISTALRRPGLRRNYQYGCPLPLYGSSCRASKSAATTPVVVQSVSGSTVNLAPGWSSRPEKHVGGLLEWTTPNGNFEIRTILKVTNGTQLMLGGLASGLTGGMSASAVLGCDHTATDCKNVHNNILNYGGQLWIPLDNPVGLTSIYY